MTQFVRRSDATFRQIAGEAVVICSHSGEVLGLNEVGAKILDALEAPCAVEEIVDQVVNAFEADRDAVKQDTERFLKMLLDAGAIEERVSL